MSTRCSGRRRVLEANHLLSDGRHHRADGRLTRRRTSTSRRVLKFVRGWDRGAPMVVHCYAGISRSTASAFIAACALNPHRDEARDRAADPRRVADRLAEPADRQPGRQGARPRRPHAARDRRDRPGQHERRRPAVPRRPRLSRAKYRHVRFELLAADLHQVATAATRTVRRARRRCDDTSSRAVVCRSMMAAQSSGAEYAHGGLMFDRFVCSRRHRDRRTDCRPQGVQSGRRVARAAGRDGSTARCSNICRTRRFRRCQDIEQTLAARCQPQCRLHCRRKPHCCAGRDRTGDRGHRRVLDRRSRRFRQPSRVSRNASAPAGWSGSAD